MNFTRKSNAQRQADWRRKDPEKAKAKNKEDAISYRQRLKNSLNEEEKQKEKLKRNERQRLFRLRKKQALKPTKSKIASPFATPQVKGKLLKKTRQTLQGTPEQNISILKTLLYESPLLENKRTDYYVLPESTISKVTSFYDNDEISRASPNVNDWVTVKVNDQRIKVSVKHLMYSLKEVYGMFREESPDVKISLSKFISLRPVNIKSITKMPHNVCCCQIHENIRCALKALQNVDPLLATIYTDYNMHRNFVCEPSSVDCFENNCENCKNSSKFKVTVSVIENQEEIVKWTKWVKTDKTKNQEGNEEQKNQYCNIEKIRKTGAISELIDELHELVPEFLNHQFIKMHQAKCSAKMIEEAHKENSNFAVICCDFAEKFKCPQQNATQSSHYGQTPISIFTIAVYHRGLVPMAIASDYEKHTKESVLAYFDIILDELPSTVNIVDVWSDNATSQFKNQFILEALKTFELRHNVKIRWHFYAPMHGKSVVDGIGGSVKRFVRSRILSQDKLVNSAHGFAEIASQMNIKVIPLKISEIEGRNKTINLASIVKTSKKVADIKKKHSFEIIEVKTGRKIIKKVVGYKITPEIVDDQ